MVPSLIEYTAAIDNLVAIFNELASDVETMKKNMTKENKAKT